MSKFAPLRESVLISMSICVMAEHYICLCHVDNQTLVCVSDNLFHVIVSPERFQPDKVK